VFRAFSRPSSGATTTAVSASDLPSELGDSSVLRRLLVLPHPVMSTWLAWGHLHLFLTYMSPHSATGLLSRFSDWTIRDLVISSDNPGTNANGSEIFRTRTDSSWGFHPASS
jgi:hypothetical protein